MEFLGFDIYLVITVVAFILVGIVMWSLSKMIGRKPSKKKKLVAVKGKKPVKKIAPAKSRPALKAPAAKEAATHAVTPVAKPAPNKRAVVPVAAAAGKSQASTQELEEALHSKDLPELKSSRHKDEVTEDAGTDAVMDFDSPEMTADPAEDPREIGSDEQLDEDDSIQFTPEMAAQMQGKPGENEDAGKNAAGSAEELKDVLASEVDSEESEEKEDEPKKGGGLLDLFEDDDDEESSTSVLAGKLEEVDSKSLEEIGKEISQSMFTKY